MVAAVSRNKSFSTGKEAGQEELTHTTLVSLHVGLLTNELARDGVGQGSDSSFRVFRLCYLSLLLHVERWPIIYTLPSSGVLVEEWLERT